MIKFTLTCSWCKKKLKLEAADEEGLQEDARANAWGPGPSEIFEDWLCPSCLDQYYLETRTSTD